MRFLLRQWMVSGRCCSLHATPPSAVRNDAAFSSRMPANPHTRCGMRDCGYRRPADTRRQRRHESADGARARGDLPTRLFHWVLMACVIGIGGERQGRRQRDGLALPPRLRGVHAAGLPAAVGPGRRALVALHELSLRPGHAAALPARRQPGPKATRSATARAARCRYSRCWRCCARRSAQGLFADDEIANSGPLVRFVSSATSSLATGWHKHWGQWLILLLVTLHVAAILVYRFKRGRDLVTPMLTGDKAARCRGAGLGRQPATRALAALLLACAGRRRVGWSAWAAERWPWT